MLHDFTIQRYTKSHYFSCRKASQSYISQNPSLMLSFLWSGDSALARWEMRHKEFLQKLCLVTRKGARSFASEHIQLDLASKSGESTWLLEDTPANREALKEGGAPFNSRIFLEKTDDIKNIFNLSEIYQVMFHFLPFPDMCNVYPYI